MEVETGAEILTGSTRLKAGTAQKLVLNMISTASMIGVGKVYKNLMVDVQSTNEKLIERSKRIIVEATGVSYEVAAEHYEKAGRNVKAAIVMVLLQCEYGEALEKLKEAKGFVKRHYKIIGRGFYYEERRENGQRNFRATWGVKIFVALLIV